MSMEMTFIITGIEILVISAIISPIIYFIFEHDNQDAGNNKLTDHEHNNKMNLEESQMTTCKNCLHFDACKQWYPSLPDKYHDGCEHFIDKTEYKPIVCRQWKNGDPYCPVCGKDKFAGLDADVWADWKPDYCPNCGSKMIGGITYGIR